MRPYCFDPTKEMLKFWHLSKALCDRALVVPDSKSQFIRNSLRGFTQWFQEIFLPTCFRRDVESEIDTAYGTRP